MSLYQINPVIPFPAGYAAGIPALHHVVWNSASPAQRALGKFKPDKYFLNLKRYPKWITWLQALNGGVASKAWRYLIQSASGVFQTGYPMLQVCVFAGRSDEPNVVDIDDTRSYYFGGSHYCPINSWMNVNHDPNPDTTPEDYVPQGLVQWYTAEPQSNPYQINKAPKANGRVFTAVLTDGTPIYMDMSLVTPVLPVAGNDPANAGAFVAASYEAVEPPEAVPGDVMHSQ